MPQKDVTERVGDLLWVGSFTQHVGGLDERGVQVGPVEAPLGIVDGETVGPTHVGHQGDAAHAIHGRPVDLWPATPLCPVHEPERQGE